MWEAFLFTENLRLLSMSLFAEWVWKIKTSFDDPDRLLELLILQLAQEARRG